MSMKLAGNVVLFSAREIVTVPSSSGWRSTSSVWRLNSGSSSRNSTPLWARADFAGRGRRAAADQAGVADRVMRRAERPDGQERLAGLQPADGAVDPRGFDRLDGRQVGQDRRHPLGQHRLARAGRAEHQDVVSAGGGDGQRPLGHLLAADVGEIDFVGREGAEQFVEPRGLRLDLDFAGEKATAWARLATGMISMPSTTAASAALLLRDQQPAKPLLLGGGHGHRQRALGRAGWCRRGPIRRRRRSRSSRSAAICPLPARMPRAIGRSNEAASLGRSAGARLITTRFCGRWKPELTIARSTRCVLSLTAASGRPTRTVFGNPAGETSTSTSTGKASMPSSEKVFSLASMCPSDLRSRQGERGCG